MLAVETSRLTREYKFVERRAGLGGKIRDLFAPQRRTKTAVRDVNVQIAPGEFVGLIGPNGAGKTTLMKLFSGIITPTKGEVAILGQTPSPFNHELKKRFSLVMGQKSQLWWDLPAVDSFNLNRALYDIDRTNFAKTTDELVGMLQVGDLVGKPVRQLSLGERMKMELISSLVHSPEILFLDEPTIGLDATSQVQIRRFLADVNANRGVTIVLTSHYMNDIKRLCQRVLLINEGQLMHDGSLNDLFQAVTGYRRVNVRFAGVPSASASGFEWLSLDADRGVLRVPEDELSEVIQRVVRECEVAEVSVEDDDIEASMQEIYATKLVQS